MKNLSPKEIAGILPANTIDTDFKADLFAAMLVEAGVDPEQIRMVRKGSSGNNIMKDIESIELKSIFTVAESSYVEIKTNRRGIYDSLPEGLFHASIYPNKVKDKEKILEEIKQHREEEFFIRSFFGLFEDEADHEAIEIQLIELKYDKKNKYRDYIDLFSFYWPVISLMPIRNALLLIKIIPHIHCIRNNFADVCGALSLILDVPISMELKRQRRNIKGRKPNRIGEMRLGVNSSSVGKFHHPESDISIHIGDIPVSRAQSFMQGNPDHKILTALTELFLGADKEYDVKISVVPSERKAYLKSSDSTEKCYLGINSYL